MKPTARRAALLAATLLLGSAAWADEAAIRKNLAERLPSLPKIDEVSKTPIPGLWEVRLGAEVVYSDENGQHLIQGNIIDTRSKTDLTQARLDKLSAIDFASLPLKQAVVFRQGSGARRLVVFADPHCGYCKRLEKDLLALKDVTIYNFIYPILGPESNLKSRDIWCAKEPAKAWRAWMVDGQSPPKAGTFCDSAGIEANVELGRKYRLQGTPAMVFEDGTRAPGALPLAQIEARLAAATKKH
jgi:thiol:disulfide interchange protein DsbC